MSSCRRHQGAEDSRRQGWLKATGGLRLDAKDRERLNSGVQSVLVKEMFRLAELVAALEILADLRWHRRKLCTPKRTHNLVREAWFPSASPKAPSTVALKLRPTAATSTGPNTT
jgi:hypothetical protein